jgi:FkbM family methyltransferase
MLPLHLGIKVVVNHRKDHGRAQFCGKEKLTCEWIKDYYKKGDVIYDIGANIGAVSLISAFYLEKDCKIYAFEPLPSTYGTLFENIMLNNCDKIITPINTALSNKMERDQFHLTSTGSGSSGHSVSGSAVHIKNNEKILNILTQTLDNFVDFYHIEQPNHIKIDVDGHDYEVLMGGEKNILNNKSLKTILIEKNNKEEKIRTLLKKYGFVEIELKDHRGIYENMGFVRGA